MSETKYNLLKNLINSEKIVQAIEAFFNLRDYYKIIFMVIKKFKNNFQINLEYDCF